MEARQRQLANELSQYESISSSTDEQKERKQLESEKVGLICKTMAERCFLF